MFAEKLKELRAQKGISQAALAEAIHVSRSAVAKWENGLGLPGEDSLELLAGYFGVPTKELLSDKRSEQAMVEKTRIIEDQNRIIIGFTCGAGIGLFLLAYLLIPSLRECLSLVALGVIFIILGAFNIKGNIATIHWYNRRKVTKEDQLPYCRLMGVGTLLMGMAMIIAAVVQTAVGGTAGAEAGAVVNLAGVVIGLGLCLYAQMKYNKGIF